MQARTHTHTHTHAHAGRKHVDEDKVTDCDPHLANWLYAWAKAQQERIEGDGDSLSSSTPSLRSHSIQSSLEIRPDVDHAYMQYITTGSYTGTPNSVDTEE